MAAESAASTEVAVSLGDAADLCHNRSRPRLKSRSPANRWLRDFSF